MTTGCGSLSERSSCIPSATNEVAMAAMAAIFLMTVPLIGAHPWEDRAVHLYTDDPWLNVVITLVLGGSLFGVLFPNTADRLMGWVFDPAARWLHRRFPADGRPE
jgi:hypothetical protein